MGLLRKLYEWVFRSLANQLLVTYISVITIALVVVTIWALVVIQSESITDLHNALEVEAMQLSLEIDNDLALDSETSRRRIKAAVDRHANKLDAKISGISITVVNDDGHVVADSGLGATASRGENISNQSEINDALAGVIGISNRRSSQTNSNWLFVAVPMRSPGHTTGVIRVGVPLTDVENRLRNDLYIFLRIIIATGVVTVLISLWLARRVNRPVKEMSAMARNIAVSGDISEFVPVVRRDEIGELGLSFNQMIGRLREQERLRQEFIANASHELKTPTMAIGSVVEALQAGAANDPKLRDQFLGSLERLVDRQSSLLKDLLDISRLDGGLETDWHASVNIRAVIAEAIEQIRPQAVKKEIQIVNIDNLGAPGDEVLIPGNLIQLQRAIINILTNGVNYTPTKGSITVAARMVDGDRLAIRVADNGQGIDADDLPHIFERFYRADKSRTRTSGGTGLGLAITREIIARHHGTIEVESTVGKGSTFTITLPSRTGRITK